MLTDSLSSLLKGCFATSDNRWSRLFKIWISISRSSTSSLDYCSVRFVRFYSSWIVTLAHSSSYSDPPWHFFDSLYPIVFFWDRRLLLSSSRIFYASWTAKLAHSDIYWDPSLHFSWYFTLESLLGSQIVARFVSRISILPDQLRSLIILATRILLGIFLDSLRPIVFWDRKLILGSSRSLFLLTTRILPGIFFFDSLRSYLTRWVAQKTTSGVRAHDLAVARRMLYQLDYSESCEFKPPECSMISKIWGEKKVARCRRFTKR